MNACNPCLDLICPNPEDLEVGGIQVFAKVPFVFIINCPPGFYCYIARVSVTITPDRIPPVTITIGNNALITLTVQGCLTLITRQLPGNASQATINLTIAQMQQEAAAQQAVCDVIRQPPGGNVNVEPPIIPPKIFPSVFDIQALLFPGCVGVPLTGSFILQHFVPGGFPPFTWTIISGSLPPGMSIATAPDTTKELRLFGTPTMSGSFMFLLQATDAHGNIAQRAFTIEVMEITVSSTLPPAQIGQPYSFQFTASGGTPPYTFFVSDGALPDGLTLSLTGLLSGTPTGPLGASFNFTVCASSQ